MNEPPGKKATIKDLLGNRCRYCEDVVMDEASASITHSYWSGFPFICHKSCKDEGVKLEAFDCQMIDADCNDCKHYQRGVLAPETVSQLKRTDGRIVEVVHKPNVFIGGRCLKFNRTTVASPNKWSGYECFEHRRL
jgi:hypothetical protein